jgi:hypothetical protein
MKMNNRAVFVTAVFYCKDLFAITLTGRGEGIEDPAFPITDLPGVLEKRKAQKKQ